MRKHFFFFFFVHNLLFCLTEHFFYTVHIRLYLNISEKFKNIETFRYGLNISLWIKLTTYVCRLKVKFILGTR